MKLIMENWKRFLELHERAFTPPPHRIDDPNSDFDISQYIGSKLRHRLSPIGLDALSATNPPPEPLTPESPLAPKVQPQAVGTEPDLEQEDSNLVATIIRSGVSKPITFRDAKIFARMIHAETAGRANDEDTRYMVWALVNRLGINNIFWNQTWARFLYSYSQPINPSWRRGGRACPGLEKHLRKIKPADPKREKKIERIKRRYLTTAGSCAKHRLVLRNRYASMSDSSVNQSILRAVMKLFRGDSEFSNPGASLVGWYGAGAWKKTVGTEEIGSRLKRGRAVQEAAIIVHRNMFIKRIDKTPIPTKMIPADPLSSLVAQVESP
jgi:hypothetical protein